MGKLKAIKRKLQSFFSSSKKAKSKESQDTSEDDTNTDLVTVNTKQVSSTPTPGFLSFRKITSLQQISQLTLKDSRDFLHDTQVGKPHTDNDGERGNPSSLRVIVDQLKERKGDAEEDEEEHIASDTLSSGQFAKMVGLTIVPEEDDDTIFASVDPKDENPKSIATVRISCRTIQSPTTGFMSKDFFSNPSYHGLTTRTGASLATSSNESNTYPRRHHRSMSVPVATVCSRCSDEPTDEVKTTRKGRFTVTKEPLIKKPKHQRTSSRFILVKEELIAQGHERTASVETGYFSCEAK